VTALETGRWSYDQEQKLAMLVYWIRAADPSLPPEVVRGVVAHLTARPQQRTILVGHFERCPDLLPSGDTRIPPLAQRLIERLAAAGSQVVVRPVCGFCGRARLLDRILPDGHRACGQCVQRRRLEPCTRCRRERPIERRVGYEQLCQGCYRRDPAFQETCAGCGRDAFIVARPPSGPRCAACAATKHRCVECGQVAKTRPGLLDGPVCNRCVERLRNNPGPCPGCGDTKILAFLHDQQRVCATCAGQPPRFACKQCGREDHQHGRRCAVCVLRDRVAALLAGPDGQTHPGLAPLGDALCAVDRPKSTLHWLQYSHGPAVLRRMALGEIAVSHAGLDALPRTKSLDYLRDLLVALGVLPAQVVEFERLDPWLRDLLTTLSPDHVRIVQPYATWHVLRNARAKANRGQLTPSAAEHARANIHGTINFLTFLTDRSRTLATARQVDLDDYLTDHHGRARHLNGFLNWARQRHLMGDLRTPPWQRTTPEVTLTDDDRWAAVARLLHDETLNLVVRVAGLFVLLYGQPLTRICRTTPDQIDHEHQQVTIRFGDDPVVLPAPLDNLVLALLDRRGHASIAGQPTRWLFPGGHPGRHRHAGTFRRQLAKVGIMLHPARNAAMVQLAAEIPAPVLADLLGLRPHTAVRWATLAARDWAAYTALRPHGRS